MSFGQTATPGDQGRTEAHGAASGDRGRAIGGLSRTAAMGLALCVVWAAFAAMSLLPGALVMSRHEGDAMHLAAMALRMADGEMPHLDFMTPIGIFAVAPIAALVSLGQGLGQAFVWSQILLAAALLPAAWWVAVSRFGSGLLGFAFAALVIGMTMAFVHGGTIEANSISMHYNRWAWSFCFLLMALALMPGLGRPAPRLEGAFVGVALVLLALTKVTYAVALLPAVLVAYALRKEWRAVLSGLAAAAVLLGAVTLLAGSAFWGAYLGDLMAVAGSSSRAEPGRSLTSVLVSPADLAGTLTGLAAIALLRAGGRQDAGLVLMLMLPGLVLITWQNFGNEAQWLAPLALILLALRPAQKGEPLLVAAAVALALSAGWVANMGVSPLRMAGTDVSDSGPMFPEREAHADFRLVQKRLDKVTTEAPHPVFSDAAEAPDWGAALPECDLVSGGVRVFRAMAGELEGAGFAGRGLLVADTFQSLWLFGDFRALPGGAPWNYGGLPGGAAAEFVVVPLCPINDTSRGRVLEEAGAAGWTLTEVYRGTHAAVLEIARP